MLGGTDDDVVVDEILVVVDETGGWDTCGRESRPATSTATVEEPWINSPPPPWPEAATRRAVCPSDARVASHVTAKSAVV